MRTITRGSPVHFRTPRVAKAVVAAVPAGVATVREKKARAGQIIILFAMFSMVLLGMLGLAMDLGFAFAQKRTLQNAADAGAYAGAWSVARYSATTNTLITAAPNVSAATANNVMSGSTQAMERCSYTTYDYESNAGDCAGAVPTAARGVRVDLTESHDTFFIHVVPGAPSSVTTAATAMATVQRYSGTAADAPIIVCGSHSAAALNVAGSTIDLDIPIWTGSGINPAAVGMTFRIHDEQLWKMPSGASAALRTAADCGQKDDKGADFKGINDQNKNTGKRSDAFFDIDSGNMVGLTRTTVAAIGGCTQNVKIDGCVALLPIADNRKGGTKDQVYVVGWATFLITEVSNSHNGKLLDNVIFSGPSTKDWTGDDTTPVVVRLSQ